MLLGRETMRSRADLVKNPLEFLFGPLNTQTTEEQSKEQSKEQTKQTVDEPLSSYSHPIQGP